MRHAAALASLVLLVATPGALRAEDPPAEPDRFRFDLGWERGITYRYEQRLDDLDPTGVVGDTVLRGRIGGSLYLDAGWGGGPGLEDDGFAAAVRRARIYTSGRLERFVATDYKVEFAVERGRLFLNDFYVRWHPSFVVDSLRVGYFDPPLAYQNMVASSSRALMEVASPVAAFVPGFRLGVEASGVHAEPSLTWFANVSSVGQDPEVGDASDQPLRLSGRLVWRPWGEPSDEAPLLHLGASLGWMPDAGGHIRHRSRPESFLFDEVVDTGDVDGGETVVGAEGVWREGALVVQGEAFVSRMLGSDAGRPVFWGAYVQVNRALTGEVRAYDASGAVLRRLVPASPLAWGGGGTGALEFTGRLSWIDLSEDEVRGGQMLALAFGPAWTWNANVRVLGGIVVAHVGGRPDAGWLGVFQTRLELAF